MKESIIIPLFCKRSYFLIILIGLFVFSGCGSSNGGDASTDFSQESNSVTSTGTDTGTDLYPDCSVEAQNKFVYDLMKDIYLWYETIPEIKYADYASPEELLKDIRYDIDRWSFISSKEDYYSYYEEGKYLGIGVSFKYDIEGNIRISLVYKGSPADNGGIKRGQKLLEINGKRVQEIEDNNLWDVIMGKDEVGVEVKLKLMDLDENTNEIILRKEWIFINTAQYYDIFRVDNKKIGYLMFLSFLETSYSDLNPLFDLFKDEDIDELILDLRYNRGGRVSIAQYLSSLIHGDGTEGGIFLKTVHNDKHADWDGKRYFEREENSLNLGRIVVITSESTCSASESVINGLSPYVEVVIVGSHTCGKPFGMYTWEFCDKVINPISYKLVNADEEGDYYNGIQPDCYAQDELTERLGSLEEASVKEALYYIESGTCSLAEERSKGVISRYRGREVPYKDLRREVGAF